LTKDNKLVRLHGNMTPTSYKIVNYFLWKAVKEGRLEDLEVNAAEIARLLCVYRRIRATQYDGESHHRFQS